MKFVPLESVQATQYCRLQGEQLLSRRALGELVEAVLGRGAAFRFEAAGWSMSPFIREGDVLTLSPLSTAPRAGELVAYLHPADGRLVVHRVVGSASGGFLLRGDNLSEPDGLVTRDHILGRVTKVERRSRAVRLGLGPERLLIAWFSAHRLLQPAVAAARRLLGRPVWQGDHRG